MEVFTAHELIEQQVSRHKIGGVENSGKETCKKKTTCAEIKNAVTCRSDESTQNFARAVTIAIYYY